MVRLNDRQAEILYYILSDSERNERNRIYIIVGASGTGKTTLGKEIERHGIIVHDNFNWSSTKIPDLKKECSSYPIVIIMKYIPKIIDDAMIERVQVFVMN